MDGVEHDTLLDEMFQCLEANSKSKTPINSGTILLATLIAYIDDKDEYGSIYDQASTTASSRRLNDVEMQDWQLIIMKAANLERHKIK